MSQQVVLDDAPEFRLVPVDDGKVVVAQEFGAVCRFAVERVRAAVLLDDFGGNP